MLESLPRIQDVLGQVIKREVFVTGTEETRLIVLRGNSGSGKSSLARAIRRIKPREISIIGQDVLRRDILHVRDEPGNGAIGLIDLTARYALESGMHVVIEGILYDEIYGSMLRALLAEHRGKVSVTDMSCPSMKR